MAPKVLEVTGSVVEGGLVVDVVALVVSVVVVVVVLGAGEMVTGGAGSEENEQAVATNMSPATRASPLTWRRIAGWVFMVGSVGTLRNHEHD